MSNKNFLKDHSKNSKTEKEGIYIQRKVSQKNSPREVQNFFQNVFNKPWEQKTVF